MSSHGPSSPLQDFPDLSPEEMTARAEAFRDELRRRRTVRDYSTRPVPREVIEACLEGAAAAPNGANLQPWHFVVISNPELKHRIRLAAEKEEKAFYSGRAPEEWLEVLGPLGTDAEKPFLEDAPYLIAVFAESYHLNEDGTRRKNYYVTESVGIATGMLITALHTSGLATLTHTPSPMGFLNDLLDRPPNERAFLLLVVGYPASDAQVPEISKKPLEEIATFLD